jgi:hypothetical protein
MDLQVLSVSFGHTPYLPVTVFGYIVPLPSDFFLLYQRSILYTKIFCSRIDILIAHVFQK